MRTSQLIHLNAVRLRSAFTLVEVVVAVLISGMLIGGIVYGYVTSARNAEWAAYSLAANSMAMQAVERARACQWDPWRWPAADSELQQTNFPVIVDILDVPQTSTGNPTFATNYVTISTISTNPPLRMIHAECVWQFINGRVYTNEVATYRAPDQ